MRTPPFLLGAALLFWGWQTDFLVVGAVMAVMLESARFIKARWEFSDDDLSRIWTFCALLFLATLVYAFTSSAGPATFGGLFQHPNLAAQRNAGAASARTAAAIMRWVPMVFFLFAAAQAFSSREEIPLTTISLIMRRRWKEAQKLGQPLPEATGFNAAYPYFAACLVGASVHPGEGNNFFWGLCVLLAWVLWSQRSRRFSVAVWAGTLAAAMVFGYFGQRGLGPLQRIVENYNPQWMFRFARGRFDPAQSKTALGQIGRVKASGQIVIRLEPKSGSPPPTYLREASYRAYRAQAWHAGPSKDDFESVLAQTNGTTWVLLPEKTNTVAVNIACYLERGKALLPLPSGSARLENLGAYLLTKNSAGAVLAEGPGLVVFDALYGPGATLDSPPATNEDVSSVPAKEVPALDKVIAELQLTNRSTDQVLRAINGFFQDKFSYRTWQGPDRMTGTNETPLSRFLLRSRSGHCEYFATATVLLLRRLDIPARYAVGYAVHEASGRKYVVRQRDAHAWCLVWDGAMWRDFDTTPASWVAEEGKRISPLQFLSDLWTGIGFLISKFRWGQSNLRQYLLWTLVPVLALLFYQIAFRRRWRRQKPKPSEAEFAVAWPGLDSEFYQLERKLAEYSVARQPSEPLSSWLRRAVATAASTEVGGSLWKLVRLHYRYRFDPQGLSESDRAELRRGVEMCLVSLEEKKPGSANS